MVKLVLDLDGTLVSKQGKISQKVLDCFHQKAYKLDISICTGRFSDYTLQVIQQLKLHSSYHICDGGATIIDSLGHISWSKHLDKRIINTALSLKKYLDVDVIFSDIGQIHLTEINQAQIIIRRVKEPELKTVDEKFSHFPVDVQKVWYWDGKGHTLSITRSGVNKGFALKKLAHVSKIPLSEIAMVADGDNDIPAFQLCGTRIAMGNASQKLKKLANYYVGSVHDDGVIEAIDLLLKGR